MATLSEGEHWLRMRDMTIKQLTPEASAPGRERGEEMARSLLRNALTARRLRPTRAHTSPSVFHVLESCECAACRALRKKPKRA